VTQDQLDFLQVILLEYEERNPDWRFSLHDFNGMLDVRALIGQATIIPAS
jgi:hypothetical protein